MRPEPTKPVVETTTDEILASATVTFWARNHGIDLKDVKGTGRKGRILKDDIINFIENNKNRPIRGKVLKQ